MDRVQVLKRETATLGGSAEDEQPWDAPIEPQEDAIETAGIYFQDGSNRDETTLAWREGDNLKFKDVANPTGRALADITSDPDAIHDNVDGEVNAVTAKESPVGADVLLIEDSEASYAKKKVSITNLPGGADPDAIHDNVDGEINAIAAKGTPVDADVLVIEDSAASFAKKKVSIADLPGGADPDAIHDNEDGEIAAITEKTTPVGADVLVIEDSAASYAKKKVQITNLPGGEGGVGLPISNIIYVDKTHGDADYSTIQAALDASEDGDIILVGPGVYTEQLTIENNVIIRGFYPPLVDKTVGTEPVVQVRPALTADGQAAIKNEDNLLKGAVLENLWINPTWDCASGTGYGVLWTVTSTDKLVLINCLVDPGSIGETPRGALVAARAAGNGDIWAYNSKFRVDDGVSQLPSDINTIECDGEMSNFRLHECHVTENLPPDPPAQIQASDSGKIWLRGTVCDGKLKSTHAGDRFYIDTSSQWNGLDGISDDDTEVKLVLRESVSLHTNGQNDIYKLPLRDIGGVPGNQQNGDVWFDGTNIKGREGGADYNLAGVGHPFSNIIYVDKTHGDADYDTIQAAIDAASTGDVILVGPGFYIEKLTGKSGVVIQGSGPNNCYITFPEFTDTDALITMSTSGTFYIKNFGIQAIWGGGVGEDGSAISCSTGKVIITDCEIYMTEGVASGGTMAAIKISSTGRVDVIRNYIVDSFEGEPTVTSYGVWHIGTSYVNIRYSNITGINAGILVNDASADLVMENSYTNNLILTSAGTVYIDKANRIDNIVGDSNITDLRGYMLYDLPFGDNVLTVSLTSPIADYSTIQAAVNAASAGDVILIGPGIYNEQLTLKDGVSLEGIGGVLPLATSGNTLTTVIAQSASTGPAHVAQTPGSGEVRLKNIHFKLTWTGSTGDARALYGAGASVRAENCGFEVNGAAATGGNAYGVHIGSGAGGFYPRMCETKVSGSSLTTEAGFYTSVMSPFIAYRSVLNGVSKSVELNHFLSQMQLYDCILGGDLVLTNASSSCYLRGSTYIGGDIVDTGNKLKVQTIPWSDIGQKTSPVGADRVLIEDSADAGRKKAVQISNLPGGADPDAIHDNVDGEINAITAKATPVGADILVIEDSAASFAKKKVAITNLPGGADPDAIHDNVDSEINAVAAKESPVGADVLLIEDSEASYAKKKVSITNLPGGADSDAIHDNVDGEINAIAAKGTPVDADVLVIEDSAASFAKKKVSIADLPGGADPDAIHDNVDGEIAAITEKTSVVSEDFVLIEDSESSNTKKRTTVKNLLARRREKSVTIEDPSASEDISWFFSNIAITIAEIRAVVGGSSPSVTWTIRHGTDRSATGAEVITGGTTTTSTTTGDDITTFDDATVVADSHVWIETNVSSQCTWIHLTVFYTED